MNEETLYRLAYTVCRVIDEKNDLKRENEYLKSELKKHNDALTEKIKEDERFIGEIFSTLINNVTK